MNLLTISSSFLSILFGVSTALPAGSNGDVCPGGKAYYRCSNNGFNGCCSVDPCALPSCPDIKIPIDPNPPIFRNPPWLPPLHRGPEPPVCVPGAHKLYQPTMHTIRYDVRNTAGSTGPDLSIYQCANSTDIAQQLAVFPTLPAGAKDCYLSWAAAAGRNFSSSGSGLVSVYEVDTSALGSSFVAQPTWNAVIAAMGKAVGHADFASWDDQKVGEMTAHNVGSVDCKTQMAFKLGVDGDETGEVDLAQDGESGFYVEYQC